MFAAERSWTDGGIDGVAIMTPPGTHYGGFGRRPGRGAGRPSATSRSPGILAQACDLGQRGERERGRLFAIVHGYSAYLMIATRGNRWRDGTLGRVRVTQVEYPQNALATMIGDGPLTAKQRWLLDPARSDRALVMGARSAATRSTASFVAGRAVARVAADASARFFAARAQVSSITSPCAGRVRRRRARGTFTAGQASAAAENDIRPKVHGERGQPEWSHRTLFSPHRRHAGRACQDDRPRSDFSPAAGGPRRGRFRRAGIRKVCARRSPTFMPRSRRSASRAASAR
ncbi:MAG: hypothetical protein IPJ62_18090 [Betaproteobacteria bacterium]|nr:hypothetical protein [Betaproteobacteria bacterium]